MAVHEASQDETWRRSVVSTPLQHFRARFQRFVGGAETSQETSRTPFEARFHPTSAWKLRMRSTAMATPVLGAGKMELNPRWTYGSKTGTEKRIDELMAKFSLLVGPSAKVREELRNKDIASLEAKGEEYRQYREIEKKKKAKLEQERWGVEETSADEWTKRPLDDVEEELVQRALGRGLPGEVLATHQKTNLEVTRADFECMKPGQWLNDEVINFYIALLQERDTKRKMQNKGPKCFFFNTFFFHKLGSNGYSYKGVARWTTPKRLQQKGADYQCLLECDKIVVPVHLPAHWTLAVINLRDQQFEYYDSLGGADSEVLELLSRFIEDEAREKSGQELDTSEWKRLFARNIPHQQNGSDCGVFAITYGDYCSKDAPFQFSQADMPFFRRRIVADVMRGAVD